MLRADARAAKALMAMRLAEAQLEARNRATSRLAGLEPQRRLSQPLRRLLYQAGRLLVAMGRKLEAYSPLEHQAHKGNVMSKTWTAPQQ